MARSRHCARSTVLPRSRPTRTPSWSSRRATSRNPTIGARRTRSGKRATRRAGNAPIYAVLHDAHDRAKAAGAKNIEDRPIKDGPVHALVDLAEEVGADLLVVGNVGLDARSAIVGRVFSIPGAVANRAKVDVLIVRTSA